MYKFACSFLGQHTPSRPLSSVLVVAGDSFFDPSLVTELGFTNASFVMDQWHLQDSGLEKMFGKNHYNMLKAYLKQMVKAKQEYVFEEEAYNGGLAFLQNRVDRNEELQSTRTHSDKLSPSCTFQNVTFN